MPAQKNTERLPNPTVAPPADLIACDCTEFPLTYICGLCHRYQHTTCAVKPDGIGSSQRSICNDCYINELNKKTKSINKRLSKAEHELRELRKSIKDDLADGQLWRHYCQLPMSSAPQEVIEATRMVWKDDQYGPEFPAPASWVDQLQERLEETILHPDHEDRIAVVFWDEGQAIHNHTLALALIRKEIVHQINHGYLKGKANTLGVLGELIGLKSVGTYWKGPATSQPAQ